MSNRALGIGRSCDKVLFDVDLPMAPCLEQGKSCGMKMLRVFLLVTCGFLLSIVGMASAGRAALLTIVNASFETPAKADGDSSPPPTPPIVGWIVGGGTGAGVFNPITGIHYSGPGATDGLQVAYSNGGGSNIAQILGDTLTANTQYTLRVDIGDRFDTAFGGYTVDFLAGTTVLASDNNTLLPNDGFLTSTVSFFAPSGHANLGQSLQIRLTSNGVQTNFDNVRLDATPLQVSVTPEPATLCIWSVFGLIAMTRVFPRRNRVAA